MKRLILLLLLTVPAVFAQTYSYDLQLQLSKQMPWPVEPGEKVEVTVTLQNIGWGAAEDINLEIVPKPPFTLLPGEDRIKNFETIKVGDSVQESFKLYVEPDTLSGDYDLEFRIYRGTGEIYRVEYLQIRVVGEPELVLQDANITGASPGGVATLKLNLSNIGTGDARDVQLFFSPLPELIPLLTSGAVWLGEIPAGKSKQAVLNLSVDEEAERKTYTAILQLVFKDEEGVERSKNISLGIPVSGEADLEIISIEPDWNRERLEIEVANKGSASASALEAELWVDGKLVGNDYISELKPNKKTTFSFPLVLHGDAELRFSFTGPMLERKEDSKSFKLDLQPKGGNEWIWIPVILLVILVIWFKRKRLKQFLKS